MFNCLTNLCLINLKMWTDPDDMAHTGARFDSLAQFVLLCFNRCGRIRSSGSMGRSSLSSSGSTSASVPGQPKLLDRPTLVRWVSTRAKGPDLTYPTGYNN